MLPTLLLLPILPICNVVTLAALKLNMFQMKLKNSSTTKLLKQMFVRCKQMIQWCVDTFLLGLLILHLKLKVR